MFCIYTIYTASVSRSRRPQRGRRKKLVLGFGCGPEMGVRLPHFPGHASAARATPAFVLVR